MGEVAFGKCNVNPEETHGPGDYSTFMKNVIYENTLRIKLMSTSCEITPNVTRPY